MGRMRVAWRAFFRVLSDAAAAEAVAHALAGPPQPQVEARPAPPAEPARKPARSDALTLLAALQREARLVDFLQESLAGYSDAQVGAAVRDVHRDCRTVIDRVFALQPVASQSEGSEIELPAGFEPARFRLVGNVTGQPPYRGLLAHHGWEATRCELPAWTGSEAAARVVAPAEVEVK